MKRIITAVLALLIVTSCNGQDVKTHGRASQANNLKSQNMNKSIVIFFSHAGDNYSVGNIEVGNTKIVADYITEIKGADQFEIVAGLESSLAFYEDAGMCLLRDSSVVASGIRIVGRDDRSNASRRALSDLAPTDTLFTILLDHQPYHLEEAERCGIDFQFSGHTHHGQIWPANWITDILYEKAYGAYQRGNTHYYVTSGLGIWGGKFRIGSQSEYLVLKLKH